MKLFNKKYLAVAVALAATANTGAAFAFADENPIDWTGVGDCHLVDNNFLPPGRGGLEQFDTPPGAAGPAPGGLGQSRGWIGHPCPQLRPNHYAPGQNGNLPGTTTEPGRFFGSVQTLSDDGITHTVVTPQGQFEKRSPFDEPPGANFINTVDSNLVDFLGREMPNTQPSALGSSEYMLHDGNVGLVDIDKTSPADDLDAIIDKIEASYKHGAKISKKDIQFAIDIIEGNTIDRAYSGYPLLHYNGPNKLGLVTPLDAAGNDARVSGLPTVSGVLDVGMIYYDQHIEATVSLIDPSLVQEVPWKINYHVKILTGGIEDFSPMVMAFDAVVDARVSPPIEGRGPFHASMDQSYFPMLEEGKQYDITIKQNKGKHLNLIYTWGWRIHPPRVQVAENALKVAGGLTLLEHEEV
ncbi:hypothetical protein MNBD_GAMMA07-87, partial [hydrothermal vent metagenome]